MYKAGKPQLKDGSAGINSPKVKLLH